MDALFGGPVAANDNVLRCAKCDATIAKPRHGQKYCSEKCQRAVATAKYTVKADYECEQCKVVFKPKRTDRTRFCSRDCAFENYRDRAAISAPVQFVVLKKRCDVCVSWFTAKTTTSKFCSDRCRAEKESVRAKQLNAANDNRDHSPITCAECGETFTTSYGDFRSVYCSAKCGRRNHGRKAGHKERARLRAAFVEVVDPNKVFDRDKWTCQICGVKTPRKLRGTYDDRAPELDHIMPLSLGGAHSYLNTQCACRKCNAFKGNTPPAQPSLFSKVA
jgi:5-methylcytosine-specific restriction endonuclease McrA